MLGGGIWVSQNKELPGAYINVVTAGRVSSALGERGIVAIALPLGKAPGTVIELSRVDFVTNAKELLGVEYASVDAAPLREIFVRANKVYVFDNGSDDGSITVEDAIAALEPYDFNILCAYTNVSEEVSAYITAIKMWRDDFGKKCQVVVYNQSTPDYEGVINVVSTVSDENAPEYALVAWVAGAEAGCEINASCTNDIYNGEYTIVDNRTQSQLIECLKNGQFVFHRVYGDIRILEDINSLVSTSETKGEDFKSNQTMRVVDQMANDTAKLFNTKYIGKIPNNSTGRSSFWADIVKHRRELESLQAIENYDSSLLQVEQGVNKKSVVVNEVVTPVNAMAQLYMTIVVQ